MIVGILILGLTLNHYYKQSAIEERLEKMSDYTDELLGFFIFNRGHFVLDVDAKKSFDEFLRTNKFATDGSDAVFGYLQDVSTQELLWHSYDPYEGKESLQKTQNYLLTFDLISEPNQRNKNILRPVMPRDPPDPMPTVFSKTHAVASLGFSYSPHSDYQLVVAGNLQSLDVANEQQITLLVILFFISILLVIVSQMALSFWVVSPIQYFEEEVREIEAGKQEFIADTYPEELVPVKNAINALLHYEKGQKQRYRDALDDLAHSLKTPLAAMQGFIEQEQRSGRGDNPRIKGMGGQLERMNDIIAHQLRRAVVHEQYAMITPEAVQPILKRLANSLQKVYRDKNIEFALTVPEIDKCRLEYDDLMELFGNLMNNSCRFCENVVAVSSSHEQDMLVVDIDDDGMGFPENEPSKLLQRGIRADSKTEGQGIGLAVSTEIVTSVGGKIELLTSPPPYLGARVRLHLPI
jgi:signal transduction histidine kinase